MRNIPGDLLLCLPLVCCNCSKTIEVESKFIQVIIVNIYWIVKLSLNICCSAIKIQSKRCRQIQYNIIPIKLLYNCNINRRNSIYIYIYIYIHMLYVNSSNYPKRLYDGSMQVLAYMMTFSVFIIFLLYYVMLCQSRIEVKPYLDSGVYNRQQLNKIVSCNLDDLYRRALTNSNNIHCRRRANNVHS